MKNVTLYSDGACSGNPGPGGYGTILVFGGNERELAQGYRRTTNNRMELRGVIAGLEALKEPCTVKVVTDSQYVVNAMTKGWARTWRANNWKKKSGYALNPDLWTLLLDLSRKHHLTFEWIRGHNGHSMNERCDTLAVSACHSTNLLEDSGYGG